MTINIRIPEALHQAIPKSPPVSSIIRNILADAVANPEALVEAIRNRQMYMSPQEDIKRYAIYLTDNERDEASRLAGRYLLSLNQLIQLLLEDVLFRAKVWPPAEKD